MSNVLRVRSEPGGEWTEIPSIQGPQGEDGFSPTVTTTPIDGGTRVTITDATGAHEFDVMNGTGGGGVDVCPMVIAQLFLPSDENSDLNGTTLVTKGSIVGAVPKVNQQGMALIHQDGHLYYNRFKVIEPFNENGIATIEFISRKTQIDNANELITIKDTEVTNISQLPESSCCVHAINSEIGFTFKDDIIYIANLGSLVTIYTLNGDMITLIADSTTGNLSVDSSGIDSWAKASEVDGKIADYLFCYSAYPPTVEIADGVTKSILTEYFVGATPTTGSFGIMIYSQGDNHYLIRFRVIEASMEVTDVQFVSDPVQINTPDLSGYALKTEIPDVSQFKTGTEIQTMIDDAIAAITDFTEVSF